MRNFINYLILNRKRRKGRSSTLYNFIYLAQRKRQSNQGRPLLRASNFTRTLADLPANICTPTYLGRTSSSLAQVHENMTIKIMGPDDMRNMGMGALLAVAQGSQQEPRLIEMQYCGGGDTPPIVLVGKGITFDSGGLSLKPANAMDEMKYDMSGAASVFGTIKACAIMKLSINLIGLSSQC